MSASARPPARRRLRRGGVALALAAAVALTGCGGEPVVPDDGGQAALDLSRLPEGIEVVSPAAPASAAVAEVAAALEAAGVEDVAPLPSAALAGPLRPLRRAAGLLGAVTVGERRPDAVVLVFDDPASALVHAARAESPLGRAGTDAAGHFAGNLVSYYAPRTTARERGDVAAAIGSLAGRPPTAPDGSDDSQE